MCNIWARVILCMYVYNVYIYIYTPIHTYTLYIHTNKQCNTYICIYRYAYKQE